MRMGTFVNENEWISIIVPVYNMEQYLERCVNSIRCQTYKKLEIILVDDGSTDASSSMCDLYAMQDSRIKVVHKKNGGLSDARNAGLAIATGAYIGYVDSDDWIEPQMYERMYKACVNHNAQVAICRYARVYQDHTILGGSDHVTVFDKEDLLRVYIGEDDRYIVYNSVWSKLFARQVVEGQTFPVGQNSEDIMYTTKAFCKITKGVYLDSCLYYYVLDRKGSIMNERDTQRMFRDEIPFWREHISYIKEHASVQLGEMAAYYFYRRLLSYYLKLSSDKKTKNDAKHLVEMMKKEKRQIRAAYAKAYGGRGDVVRMNLFLCSPWLYRTVNKVYEQMIIPIRCKSR